MHSRPLACPRRPSCSRCSRSPAGVRHKLLDLVLPTIPPCGLPGGFLHLRRDRDAPGAAAAGQRRQETLLERLARDLTARGLKQRIGCYEAPDLKSVSVTCRSLQRLAPAQQAHNQQRSVDRGRRAGSAAKLLREAGRLQPGPASRRLALVEGANTFNVATRRPPTCSRGPPRATLSEALSFIPSIANIAPDLSTLQVIWAVW